jgi:hypothetical protein
MSNPLDEPASKAGRSLCTFNRLRRSFLILDCGHSNAYYPLIVTFERRKPTPSNKENQRRATLMRFQLAMALAVSLTLHAGAFAQDVDTAAKDTGHATAKVTKDAAHGTAEAAEKTTDATGHAVKKSGKGIKKGVHEVGHGVKKGATKTADALK